MKRNLNLLLIIGFLVFLLFPSYVFAWSGDYNYEVTSFTLSGNTAKIKGWAILNNVNSGELVSDTCASTKCHRKYTNTYCNVFYNGYCNYGSMVYTKSNGTKYGGNHVASKTYSYTLVVKKVANNNTETEVNGAVKSGKTLPTSMTYSVATKVYYGNSVYDPVNGGAYFYQMATNKNLTSFNYGPNNHCYEDVGFEFNLDLDKMPKSTNIKGYRLYLTITSPNGNTSKTIPLNIGKINGFANYVDGEYYVNSAVGSKVELTITRGASWNSTNITAKKGKVDLCTNSGYDQTYDACKEAKNRGVLNGIYTVLEVKSMRICRLHCQNYRLHMPLHL